MFRFLYSLTKRIQHLKQNELHACIEKQKNLKISLIAHTSENEVLSSLIISSTSLLIEERACAKVQKRNFISSASCGIFIDLFFETEEQ